MPLNRLRAKNFRLLEDFDIPLSPQITVLVGANNSGKSNVIDAILLFKEGFRSGVREVLNTRGGFDRVVSRHDTTKVIELTVDLAIDTVSPISYEIGISRGGLVKDEFRLPGKHYSGRLLGRDFIIQRPEQEQITGNIDPANVRISVLWPQESEQIRDYFGKVVHIDPFRRVAVQENIAATELMHPTGTDLAGVLHYHNNNNRERFLRYESFVKKVIPDLRVIETPIVGAPITTVSVRFLDDELAYNLQQLSSGVKDVLLLIGAAYFSHHGALILIEEPENHLHPSAQKALIGVFKEIAAADGKQLVLTTHSETIVAQFDTDSVLFVDRRRTAERVVPLSQVDVYSASQQLGVERGLLLQLLGRTQQVVVVLEGRDDYKALEPLWEHHGLTDKVLPVRAEGGGWRDIVNWAKQLQDALTRFRLPSKVFVLLDNDGKRTDKEEHLQASGFGNDRSHVWNEVEIESYLILPTALGVISGKRVEEVNAAISEAGGTGKARFAQILSRLGMHGTPKNVIVQNALANAPSELPAELHDVPHKVRRLLGLY